MKRVLSFVLVFTNLYVSGAVEQKEQEREPIPHNAKIYIPGHRGLVGSAILRRLQKEGFTNLLTRTRKELDLTRQEAVEKFFADEKPAYIFCAAAKVGGILGNKKHPAQYAYENMAIQNNLIHTAYKNGVKKFLFLGSSCIYPRECPQPIKEEYLGTGPLEESNKSYALAKIMGLQMCDAYNKEYSSTQFISLMPTNLYGPNDNFDPENSHFIPARMRAAHEAKITGKKSVTVWGSGKVYRELLHADDVADAALYFMQRPDSAEGFYNVGTGEDMTINEAVKLIHDVVGFKGAIEHDLSKPDGTPRKQLDMTRTHAAGWQHKVALKEGLRRTYEWALENGVFDKKK